MGQEALKRIGLKVDKYYASEIDTYAIQITQKNHPNTIQIGDVTKLKGEDFKDIDLMIGGSPCQGFSMAGKQLNFEDERSKLFFEYVRLLKEINPKYFLLENVVMKKEYQDIISGYLGVQPIQINSSLVSAQQRRRLYWTNIPNITQPQDKDLYIKDILEDNVDEKYYLSEKIQERLVITNDDIPSKPNIGTTKPEFRTIGQRDVVYGYNQKIGCLLATDYKQPKQIIDKPFSAYEKPRVRKITPIECERLQTLPDNYTEGVSDTQRYKIIGNGWTVDVISHIFKTCYKLQN